MAVQPVRGQDVLDASLRAIVAGAPSRVLSTSKQAPDLAAKGREGFLRLMVRAPAPAAAGDLVRGLGGEATHIGSTGILSVLLPAAQLRRLAASGMVTRVELAHKFEPTNDEAAVHVRADQVHLGASGLDRGYTGQGVIVGVIDTGIDWKHLDFRNPDDPTKSRILAIWDQNDYDGTPPEGHAYGTLWARADIEADLGAGSSTVRHADYNGHGTHVTGTAAGNGAAVGGHRGMAYEADVIMVSTDWYTTGIVDAAAFIYQMAETLGRPVVINASLGSEAGPHDGSTLFDQAIDGLVASTGRAFVVANGNSAGQDTHWGGLELQPDYRWAYLEASGYGQDEQGYFGAPTLTGIVRTSEVANIEVQVAADSLGSFWTPAFHQSIADQTGWHSVSEIRDSLYIEEYINYPDGQRAGLAWFAASEINDTHTEVLIGVIDDFWSAGISDNGAPNLFGREGWEVRIRGAGAVHLWRDGYGFLHTDPAGNRGRPQDGRFVPADDHYTVGSPASAREVIAVGAYTNRDADDASVGQIAPFSSLGPTTDHRLKPEISAPGHEVISALSSTKAIYDDDRLAPEGLHWYLSGTSMATPVVTGSVALLLEQRPDLSSDQVLRLLSENAITDADTGPVPNNTFGNGKLDILATMLDASPADEPPSNALPVMTTVMPDTSTTAIPGTLKFRYEATDSDGDKLEWSLVDSPGKIDRDTGEFEWSPREPGTYLIFAFVSDGQVAVTSSATVVVTPSPNLAPAFLAEMPDTTVYAAESLFFAYEAIDYNEHEVTLRSASMPPGATFSEDNSPSPYTTFSVTEYFSWSPRSADVGTHKIEITASDGAAVDTSTAFVTVLQRAPELTSVLPDTTIQAETAFYFAYMADDAESDKLSWTVTEGPSGLDLNQDFGLLSWSPGVSDVGSHRVAISVSDAHESVSTSAIITVTAVPNGVPAFTATLPDTTLQAGQRLSFRFQASDPDLDSVSFGLSSGPPGVSVSQTSGWLIWDTTLGDAGMHELRVFATDGQDSVQATASVVVSTPVNATPVFTQALPDTVVVSGAILTFLYGATDPDGDALSFSLASGPASAQIGQNSGFLQWTPTDADEGVHELEVTVSDGAASASVTANVTIAVIPNTPPVFLNAPGDTTIVAGNSAFLGFSAVDGDGDPVTFSLMGPGFASLSGSAILLEPAESDVGSHALTVEATDGTDSVETSLTVTVEASASSNAPPVFVDALQDTTVTAGEFLFAVYFASDAEFDVIEYSMAQGPASADFDTEFGLLSWTPTEADVGTHSIVVAATDGVSTTLTSATVVVLSQAANNTEPVFTAVLQDTTLAVGDFFFFFFEATDPDGDFLEWQMLEGPVGASFQYGAFDWTPGPTDIGTHPVVVSATDGTASVVTSASLTIVAESALNSPPVFEDAPRDTTLTAGQFFFAIYYAFDPDFDAVTYSLIEGPSGAEFDSAIGILTWIPQEADVGTTTITVEASDGVEAAQTTSSVTVVSGSTSNTPPVFTLVPRDTTIVAGASLLGIFAAVDPDGGPVTLSLNSGPPGATFSASSGLFAWATTLEHVGEHVVSVAASDPFDTALADVAVTVAAPANVPPRFTTVLEDRTIVAGTALSVRYVAEDQDGQVLSFSLVEGPSQARVDPVLGILNWTPTASQVGQHTISVAVSDGVESVRSDARLTVVPAPNSAPEFVVAPRDTTVAAGTMLSLQFRAVDADQDTLRYALLGAPAGSTIGRLDGVFLWAPSSDQVDSWNFRVTATDRRATASVTTVVNVISSVAIEDDTPRTLRLDPAYPNPTRSRATIPLTLPAPATVAFRVFDVLGRAVLTESSSFMSGGLHLLELDMRSLGTGLYYYEVAVDGRRLTGRVIRR